MDDVLLVGGDVVPAPWDPILRLSFFFGTLLGRAF